MSVVKMVCAAQLLDKACLSELSIHSMQHAWNVRAKVPRHVLVYFGFETTRVLRHVLVYFMYSVVLSGAVRFGSCWDLVYGWQILFELLQPSVMPHDGHIQCCSVLYFDLAYGQNGRLHSRHDSAHATGICYWYKWQRASGTHQLLYQTPDQLKQLQTHDNASADPCTQDMNSILQCIDVSISQ